MIALPRLDGNWDQPNPTPLYRPKRATFTGTILVVEGWEDTYVHAGNIYSSLAGYVRPTYISLAFVHK